ncbi:MAG: hypothetical protein SFY67_16485 [Candidatus Melainabacteria bacterium]|nr:hypothetical protein [Candidatus Melainabacteria bacterium]
MESELQEMQVADAVYWAVAVAVSGSSWRCDLSEKIRKEKLLL